MPYFIGCPHCKQVNQIDGSRAGQEVRCVHCRKGFVVKLKTAADSSKPKDEAIQAKTRPAAPPAESPPPEPRRRSRDDHDDDDLAPRRRDRVDDDDDLPRRRSDRDRDRDRDRPSGRRRSSSNMGLVIGLSIGGLVLVGVIVAVVLLLMGGSEQPVANQVNPVNDGAFNEHFALLNSHEEAHREQAYQWFARTPPTHPRRPELAKLLETRVAEYRARPLNGGDGFFAAYFNWATKDNFPSLSNMARNEEFTVWGNRRRHESMLTMARLKDERGLPDIIANLESIHHRRDAIKALGEFGPGAEKAVLGIMNHRDRGIRTGALQLLAQYQTSADKLLTQAVADLGSLDEQRVQHAAEWLAKAPMDDKRRPEVAAALDRQLVPGSRIGRQHLVACAQRWATADNVPKLGQMLHAERLGGEDLIRVLANLQDIRSAEVLAKRAGNFFDGREAKQALIAMGPLGEQAAVKELTNQDGKIRVAAAEVLAAVGTTKSLSAIQNAMRVFPQDRELNNAANTALQAIRARGQ